MNSDESTNGNLAVLSCSDRTSYLNVVSHIGILVDIRISKLVEKLRSHDNAVTALKRYCKSGINDTINQRLRRINKVTRLPKFALQDTVEKRKRKAYPTQIAKF